MSDQRIQIRTAKPEDEAEVLRLMPRLAGFELSPQRDPRDLWRHDAEKIRKYFAGAAPQCLLLVAQDEEGNIAGLAFVTLQEEFMSHAPGAHLEALAVAQGYEGHGIGRSLVAQAEAAAKQRGAQSMTLHVFNSNHRAHSLYEAIGYQSEVQRCIKWL